MRTGSSALGLAASLLLAAGCVSVSPSGQASLVPASQAAPTVAQPTQTPASTPEDSAAPLTFAPPSFAPITFPPISLPTQPSDGPVTVVVVVDSGENQGTYSASGDPNCSHGAIGDDVWGAQYGNILAGPGELSSVQLTDEPDSSDKKGKSRIVSVYLTVGPVFSGQAYTLQGDRFSSDAFTYELDDQGSTAVIHFAGKTLETPLGPGGVGIDVTVSCPSVSGG